MVLWDTDSIVLNSKPCSQLLRLSPEKIRYIAKRLNLVTSLKTDHLVHCVNLEQDIFYLCDLNILNDDDLRSYCKQFRLGNVVHRHDMIKALYEAYYPTNWYEIVTSYILSLLSAGCDSAKKWTFLYKQWSLCHATISTMRCESSRLKNGPALTERALESLLYIFHPQLILYCTGQPGRSELVRFHSLTHQGTPLDYSQRLSQTLNRNTKVLPHTVHCVHYPQRFTVLDDTVKRILTKFMHSRPKTTKRCDRHELLRYILVKIHRSIPDVEIFSSIQRFGVSDEELISYVSVSRIFRFFGFVWVPFLLNWVWCNLTEYTGLTITLDRTKIITGTGEILNITSMSEIQRLIRKQPVLSGKVTNQFFFLQISVFPIHNTTNLLYQEISVPNKVLMLKSVLNILSILLDNKEKIVQAATMFARCTKLEKREFMCTMKNSGFHMHPTDFAMLKQPSWYNWKLDFLHSEYLLRELYDRGFMDCMPYESEKELLYGFIQWRRENIVSDVNVVLDKQLRIFDTMPHINPVDFLLRQAMIIASSQTHDDLAGFCVIKEVLTVCKEQIQVYGDSKVFQKEITKTLIEECGVLAASFIQKKKNLVYSLAVLFFQSCTGNQLLYIQLKTILLLASVCVETISTITNTFPRDESQAYVEILQKVLPSTLDQTLDIETPVDVCNFFSASFNTNCERQQSSRVVLDLYRMVFLTGKRAASFVIQHIVDHCRLPDKLEVYYCKLLWDLKSVPTYMKSENCSLLNTTNRKLREPYIHNTVLHPEPWYVIETSFTCREIIHNAPKGTYDEVEIRRPSFSTEVQYSISTLEGLTLSLSTGSLCYYYAPYSFLGFVYRQSFEDQLRLSVTPLTLEKNGFLKGEEIFTNARFSSVDWRIAVENFFIESGNYNRLLILFSNKLLSVGVLSARVMHCFIQAALRLNLIYMNDLKVVCTVLKGQLFEIVTQTPTYNCLSYQENQQVELLIFLCQLVEKLRRFQFHPVIYKLFQCQNILDDIV